MNSCCIQWVKRIGTGLMILVIAVMLINKVTYTHVHILSGGSMVTHAHPFSNNAEGKKNTSHQHSTLELYLLDIVEVLFLCAIAAFVLKRSAPTILFRQVAINRLLPALVPFSPGRAPPACM